MSETTRNYDLASMLAATQNQAQTEKPSSAPHWLGAPENGIVNSFGLITNLTLYESFYTGDDNEDSFYGARWLGQTFTPSTAHIIRGVNFYMKRVGSPGTVTVSIRATGTGLPTGADLVSGTFNGSAIGTSLGMYSVYFSDILWLPASTMYAVVLRATAGDGSNKITWRLKSTSGYSGGTYVLSTDSGANWATDTKDFFFKEWGHQ